MRTPTAWTPPGACRPPSSPRRPTSRCAIRPTAATCWPAGERSRRPWRRWRPACAAAWRRDEARSAPRSRGWSSSWTTCWRGPTPRGRCWRHWPSARTPAGATPTGRRSRPSWRRWCPRRHGRPSPASGPSSPMRSRPRRGRTTAPGSGSCRAARRCIGPWSGRTPPPTWGRTRSTPSACARWSASTPRRPSWVAACWARRPCPRRRRRCAATRSCISPAPTRSRRWRRHPCAEPRRPCPSGSAGCRVPPARWSACCRTRRSIRPSPTTASRRSTAAAPAATTSTPGSRPPVPATRRRRLPSTRRCRATTCRRPSPRS